MILVYDVGNTNIKTGVFDGKRLVNSWRVATVKHRTSDELGVSQSAFFDYNGIEMNAISGVVISSVVPSLNYTIEHMVRYFFRTEPLIVGPGIKTGINIRYDNPREVGADRICNAVAAYEYYGGPCVFIDFGTATTFGAMNAKGEFLGGAICPGLKVATEALATQASRLPRIEIIKPPAVINRSTIANMQAGIIYGTVGQVDFIVNKMRRELGEEKAAVVATGGLANVIAEESSTIGHIHPTLTLEGLRLIYERNR